MFVIFVDSHSEKTEKNMAQTAFTNILNMKYDKISVSPINAENTVFSKPNEMKSSWAKKGLFILRAKTKSHSPINTVMNVEQQQAKAFAAP